MKIERYHGEDDKKRWMAIRTDYCGSNGGILDGDIVEADEESGDVVVKINGEEKTLSFGPHGIRLIGRGR